MIGITFNVNNIDVILQAYDQIQCIRFDAEELDLDTQPDTPVGQPETLVDWSVVSGTEDYPFPIELVSGETVYIGYDPVGEAWDWFSSRYYDSSTGAYSAWSEPQLGEESDIYFDPMYPAEEEYDTEEQAIIDRIRLLIGDPIKLNREFGEEAMASLHPDGRTFQMAEKGWPAYITMGGKGFTSKYNPTVNGYKYLKFQEQVDEICYGCYQGDSLCGGTADSRLLTYAIDIWYYTFRYSDREIMAAYDGVFPPVGLTTDTATTQAYILQTAIDIITSELFEDSVEDGAKIDDDKTAYDPSSGLAIRKDLLDSLKDDLDDLIKSLKMADISGVLID
jgi:hypothetical protein